MCRNHAIEPSRVCVLVQAHQADGLSQSINLLTCPHLFVSFNTHYKKVCVCVCLCSSSFTHMSTVGLGVFLKVSDDIFDLLKISFGTLALLF